ncbi:unnamed protein product [Trichobilharzia regenti]|nr:unnamed protein product [Trichobilharzia regenti]
MRSTLEGSVKKSYCCYGYCIDLLRLLANRTGLELTPTPFTYDLHLVGDGQIGDAGENETHKWTGIIGEILSGKADLAVAPVSITPERAARVEFTKPFKYLGITILVKRVGLKFFINLEIDLFVEFASDPFCFLVSLLFN